MAKPRRTLQKCSCSIDVIASLIPYDKYVAAETIVSMSQVTGPVGGEFRSTETAKGDSGGISPRASRGGGALFLKIRPARGQSADFSACHSPLKTFLLVSKPFTRKFSEPFGR